MYKADCYNVMIVSPSDVNQERQIVKDIILEWNSVHSEYRKIVLNPIGWDINAFPQFGDHPQDVINSQILEHADIVIGVFWTRIGTETKEYESGSIEEITKHVEAGKPVLLYFSDKPVIPSSVDQSQYQKLQEYKVRVSKESFYHVYDSIEKFPASLNKHLSSLMNTIGSDALDSAVQKQEGKPTHSIADQLSDDEKEVLIEASKDSTGSILRISRLGGVVIQTNGKAFGTEKGDPRITAEAEALLENYERLGLVKAASYKRQIFNLTAKGFKLADEMRNDE